MGKADSSNPSHIIRVSELQNSVYWDKVSKVMSNIFFFFVLVLTPRNTDQLQLTFDRKKIFFLTGTKVQKHHLRISSKKSHEKKNTFSHMMFAKGEHSAIGSKNGF